MNQNDKGDMVLSFAAFFQILVLMLQQVTNDLNIVSHDASRTVSIVLSALPMVFSFFYIIKRKTILFLITYGSILSLILLTLIFFPNNEQYLTSEAFYLLCINVPCFLCIASIKNIYILKKMLFFLSYPIFAMGIAYNCFLFIGMIPFSGYSMSFSYYLLLPALVFIHQRKALYTIAFIIACVMMLMLGSRGALVAAIIYAISLWLIDKKNKSLILLAAVALVIFFNSFLALLLTLSQNLGVTSRTLYLLLEGELANSTGRSAIYSVAWNSIMDSPFWGYGIYGDRIILNGTYCHNIFLEMLHNFGLFLGGGLILLLSFIIIHSFLNSDNENKKLLLMFFCYGFIPLLVSKSYLADAGFGLFLGSLILLKQYSSPIARSRAVIRGTP